MKRPRKSRWLNAACDVHFSVVIIITVVVVDIVVEKQCQLYKWEHLQLAN